jgi:hypothetical protein
MTSPAPLPQQAAATSSLRGRLTIVALAVACAALAAATAGVFAFGRSGSSASAPAPAPPTAPAGENIPQPNAACTPADDRKITPGADLTKILWFGWVDGKQAEMPLSQALTQRTSGRHLRDAWYCPPRADWK